MKKALTTKLGPAPRWVWLSAAVLAGAILYLRHKSAQAAADAANSDTTQDPNTATGADTSSLASPYSQDGTGGTYYPSSDDSGYTTGYDQGFAAGGGGADSLSVPSDQVPAATAPPAQGPSSTTVTINEGTGTKQKSKKPKTPTSTQHHDTSKKKTHSMTGGGGQTRNVAQHLFTGGPVSKPAAPKHTVEKPKSTHIANLHKAKR